MYLFVVHFGREKDVSKCCVCVQWMSAFCCESTIGRRRRVRQLTRIYESTTVTRWASTKSRQSGDDRVTVMSLSHDSPIIFWLTRIFITPYLPRDKHIWPEKSQEIIPHGHCKISNGPMRSQMDSASEPYLKSVYKTSYVKYDSITIQLQSPESVIHSMLHTERQSNIQPILGVN